MTSSITPSSLVSFDDLGSGPAVLVLHGGGGPRTVAGLAAHLSASHRVIVPTHPGWEGTPRDASLARVADLATLYRSLLAELGLSDVTVIGSSLGGWITAEMAAQDAGVAGAAAGAPAGVVGRIVVVDGAGILIDGVELPDFFALDPRGIAALSWHDPEKFFFDPTALPEAARAVQKANMATMADYQGDDYMHDPSLAARLGDITVPTLFVWGESDGVFPVDYGRAYAASIPGARFELVSEAGHLPQLEQPEATFALVDAFVG
ncbi:alpha/beta fold hydrolase [Frondihabitans cladoniiphilus]|uniref:Alpha/beta hydrolase n=1 Tax=Frondihabitans cladoniiphilus TaxID=715785 RepID=A0ABP8VXC2_9MICO